MLWCFFFDQSSQASDPRRRQEHKGKEWFLLCKKMMTEWLSNLGLLSCLPLFLERQIKGQEAKTCVNQPTDSQVPDGQCGKESGTNWYRNSKGQADKGGGLPQHICRQLVEEHAVDFWIKFSAQIGYKEEKYKAQKLREMEEIEEAKEAKSGSGPTENLEDTDPAKVIMGCQASKQHS